MAKTTPAQAPDDFDSAPVRLYSLDALRGFDMFWIMGADAIFYNMDTAAKTPFWHTIAVQLDHPAWNGFHAYDLIFPLFLFMAGVSTPFSVGRELEKGTRRPTLLLRVIKRALTLVFLGFFVNNGLQLPVVFLAFPALAAVYLLVLLLAFLFDPPSRTENKPSLIITLAIVAFFGVFYYAFTGFGGNGKLITQVDDIRFASVLGRIGIAYMFANIIYLYAKEWVQIVWFWFFIIGYYLLLKFTSAPGFHPGDLTPQGNFASYMDRTILPGHLYVPYPGTKINMHDPEGLFSTIPAISTGLLGIMAGLILKTKDLTQNAKAARLAIGGLIFLVLAQVWNLDFPINKNLWSSSFVLNVGGISLLLMSLFYYIIDVLGYKKWAFFFKVIGMNSILIYISSHFISWNYTNKGLFGWLGKLAGEPWGAVLMAITFVLVKWLFLRYLYEKKTFLRV